VLQNKLISIDGVYFFYLHDVKDFECKHKRIYRELELKEHVISIMDQIIE